MTQLELDELSDDLVLVVDVEDILATLERNSRDAQTNRDHQLRFDRPLEGRVPSTTHVDEQGHSWPNPDSAPLTLLPSKFIHDNAQERTVYPLESTVHETAMQADGVDHVSEVSQDTLDKCWHLHTGIWEDEVRGSLQDTVTISKYGRDGKVEPREIPVEYDE